MTTELLRQRETVRRLWEQLVAMRITSDVRANPRSRALVTAIRREADIYRRLEAAEKETT